MQTDASETLAAIRAAFDAYEAALIANDVAALSGFFWADPRAVRLSPGARSTATPRSPPSAAAATSATWRRDLTRSRIIALGPDVGIATAEYRRRGSGRRGAQSQTWARFPQGWRIVAAHVSLEPASRVRRPSGSITCHGPVQINPPVQKPAPSRLTRLLSDEIVAGRLAPGVRLDEQALADRFGLSRTPVREALGQLAAMGLVEKRPHRGVVVAAFTVERMVHMFEVMAELEAICARLAARRMSIGAKAALDAQHRASEGLAAERRLRGLRGGEPGVPPGDLRRLGQPGAGGDRRRDPPPHQPVPPRAVPRGGPHRPELPRARGDRRGDPRRRRGGRLRRDARPSADGARGLRRVPRRAG